MSRHTISTLLLIFYVCLVVSGPPRHPVYRRSWAHTEASEPTIHSSKCKQTYIHIQYMHTYKISTHQIGPLKNLYSNIFHYGRHWEKECYKEETDFCIIHVITLSYDPLGQACSAQTSPSHYELKIAHCWKGYSYEHILVCQNTINTLYLKYSHCHIDHSGYTIYV